MPWMDLSWMRFHWKRSMIFSAKNAGWMVGCLDFIHQALGKSYFGAFVVDHCWDLKAQWMVVLGGCRKTSGTQVSWWKRCQIWPPTMQTTKLLTDKPYSFKKKKKNNNNIIVLPWKSIQPTHPCFVFSTKKCPAFGPSSNWAKKLMPSPVSMGHTRPYLAAAQSLRNEDHPRTCKWLVNPHL